MNNYYQGDRVVDIYLRLLNDTHDNGILVGKTRELMNTQICLKNPEYSILPFKKNWQWAFQELLDRMSYTYGYKKLTNPGRAFIYRPRWEKKLEKEGGKFDYSYGEMFNSQIQKVYEELKSNKTSREAIIVLWTPKYLVQKENYQRRPCTLYLHFLIRDKHLHCFVSMRTNDIINLLPYDIFHHTFIQRWLAHKLNLPLGCYYHSASHSYYPKKREMEGRDYFNKFHKDLQDTMAKLKYVSYEPLSFGDSLDSDFKIIYQNYNELENTIPLIVSPFLKALVKHVVKPKESTFMI